MLGGEWNDSEMDSILGRGVLYVEMRTGAPCLFILFVMTVYDGKRYPVFYDAFFGTPYLLQVMEKTRAFDASGGQWLWFFFFFFLKKKPSVSGMRVKWRSGFRKPSRNVD